MMQGSDKDFFLFGILINQLFFIEKTVHSL